MGNKETVTAQCVVRALLMRDTVDKLYVYSPQNGSIIIKK